MAGIEIVVSVEDDDAGRLDEIAATLESLGMRIEHKMSSIGTISGVADDVAIEEIRAVDGVEAVEVAAAFQLPHPDADVQ